SVYGLLSASYMGSGEERRDREERKGAAVAGPGSDSLGYVNFAALMRAMPTGGVRRACSWGPPFVPCAPDGEGERESRRAAPLVGRAADAMAHADVEGQLVQRRRSRDDPDGAHERAVVRGAAPHALPFTSATARSESVRPCSRMTPHTAPRSSPPGSTSG